MDVRDDGRDERGRFAVGNPGGPGRPKGSAAKEFRAAVNDRLMDVIQKVLELALEGDLRAARLILDRTHPTLQAGLLELAGRLDELEGILDDDTTTAEAGGQGEGAGAAST